MGQIASARTTCGLIARCSGKNGAAFRRINAAPLDGTGKSRPPRFWVCRDVAHQKSQDYQDVTSISDLKISYNRRMLWIALDALGCISVLAWPGFSLQYP